MAQTLILVSGWIELLFGLFAIIAPQQVISALGGATSDGAILALIRLLGAATFGIGAGALLARRAALAAGTRNAVFGLGSYAGLALALYNLIAAPVLIYGATVNSSSGMLAGAVLHTIIGLLFGFVLLRHLLGPER